MNKYLYNLLILAAFAFTACEDDEGPFIDQDCGLPVIIGPQIGWPQIPSTFARVDEVDGTCLTVTYGYSGCGELEGIAKFYTTGAVAESSPTQTRVTLQFTDSLAAGACLAYFENRETFDLSEYLTPGTLPTLLTVVGADTTVLIE